MKTRHCLALVLTSALAIGCAAARAQDDPQGPPPGPRPMGPPDGAQNGPRPKFDPAEAKRRLTEKLAEAEKAIADVEASKDRAPDAERRLADLRRHAEMLRSRIAQIDKGEMPAPMGRGEGRGQGDGRGQGMGPDDERRRGEERRAQEIVENRDAPGPRDLRDRAERGRRPPMGPDGQPGMNPGGPPRGPGASVEQRLEMLERAVREMHEMFAKHDVPPEMRERAEREMRERRPQPDGRPGENRPGENRPFDGPPRPDAGQGPNDARPPQPPRPPTPRPGMPPMEMSDAERAEVKTFLAAKEQEMAAHMRQAAEQMEEMKRQLADTRAALEKAQAELDQLKKQNAGK